jgi:hypothetical protein
MDTGSIAEWLASPLWSVRLRFISHAGDCCQW